MITHCLSLILEVEPDFTFVNILCRILYDIFCPHFCHSDIRGGTESMTIASSVGSYSSDC